ECPLPQIRLAWQPTPYLPIDHPRHGSRPGGVIATMMAICLTQALVPTHPTDRVFDFDPALGERPIEAHVLGRSVFATRFATWRCAKALRMHLSNPHIRQVANRPHSLRQAREKSRLLEHCQVSRRSDHAFSHIAPRAVVLINRHLAFE